MAVLPEMQPSDIEVYHVKPDISESAAIRTSGNFADRNTVAKGDGEALTRVSAKDKARSTIGGYEVC